MRLLYFAIHVPDFDQVAELLDLIMPNVDGFRVLEEMRRDPGLAEVPVVVLTATSYEEDVWAQRGGPNCYSPARWITSG